MALHPEILTWTSLLSQWMRFAQAAVALPADAEGDRWRTSVPCVINLQAVTFALSDLARLPLDERALGRDRAELLIEDNAAKLADVWSDAAMPGSLAEIERDARDSLWLSHFAGAVELVWPGPDVMIVPHLEPDLDAGGSLAVMMPGTLVMPGEPVAWWAEREERVLRAALCSCVEGVPAKPQQVYREFDHEGMIVRDVILPIDAPMPAALPLLVPLLEAGRRIGHFTMDADIWEVRQREAMPTGRIEILEHTTHTRAR
jgi:hypothetical protein